VRAEVEELRQASGNCDWEEAAASLEQSKAQLHDLDKQSSSISGELSGLSKVLAIDLNLDQPCRNKTPSVSFAHT
jgi:hypothetical protein